MADVFVSYASEDRDRVRPLVEVLESRGWSVWWDRTLHAGPRFDVEIEKALDAARCVVVVWSEEAVRSDWVRSEAHEGQRRDILVPVALDGATPPLPFRRNQTADLRHWPEQRGDLDMLVAGVSSVLMRTTSGVSEPAHDDAPIRAPKPRSPRRSFVVATLLATALVAVASYFYLARSTSSTVPIDETRTAVFTFTARADDQKATALANDIANEIVQTMDSMGLPPIAIDGPLGEERSARALELGAAYALDGNVRSDAGELLVSVRIEDLQSRTTLWANSYRDKEEAAFALRLRVATQATDTLRCANPSGNPRGFGGWFRVGERDTDALRTLLRMCSQIRTNKADENREPLRALVGRYPDSSQINAALAQTLVASLSATPPDSHAALLAEAERHSQRALELDASNGQAVVSLVSVRLAQHAPAREIATLLKDGLRRAPEHATVNAFYGEFLVDTGRLAEAEPYLRRGVQADPLSPAKKSMLALGLSALGRTSEAERLLDDAATRWPLGYIWIQRVHLAVFDRAGDPEALFAVPPDEATSADQVGCWRGLSAALAIGDPAARHRAGVDAVDRCATQNLLFPSSEIVARAAFDDVDGIFATAADVHYWDEPAVMALFLSETRAARADPRFMPLMQRLGLFALWKETDVWPDFCGATDHPYDCRAVVTANAS